MAEILRPFKTATELLEKCSQPVVHKYGRIMLDLLYRKLPPQPGTLGYNLRLQFCEGAGAKLTDMIDDPFLILELAICQFVDPSSKNLTHYKKIWDDVENVPIMWKTRAQWQSFKEFEAAVHTSVKDYPREIYQRRSAILELQTETPEQDDVQV